jgi:hypothetical protein
LIAYVDGVGVGASTAPVDAGTVVVVDDVVVVVGTVGVVTLPTISVGEGVGMIGSGDDGV